MSFLIDTDTCSAHLKSNPLVTARFLQYTGQLYISTITLGELLTWALRANAPPKRHQDLTLFLNDVTVLDVCSKVAYRFGETRAGLFDRGLPMPELDLLIASTALTHDFTLVTHNLSDFQNVPRLKMIDWLIP